MKPATVRYGIKCIVPSCNNKMSENRFTSYFSFPKDPIRCSLWVEKCGIDGNVDVSKNHVRVCGEHFENRCFLNDLKNRLQSHAVPTLFTDMSSQDKISILPLTLDDVPKTCNVLTSTTTSTKVLANYFKSPSSRNSIHHTSPGFPKDEFRKSKWKKACGINLSLPTFKVCSDHFLPEDYELSGYLKKHAVPCKRNVSMHSKNSVATDINMIYDSNNVCLESEIYVIPWKHELDDIIETKSEKLSPPKRMNANTIGTLSPSHFNSPDKAKRHLSMVKHKYKQKQIQNHNLQRKLKRLNVKLKTYGELIKKLQQKLLLSENASRHLQSCKSNTQMSVINVGPDNVGNESHQEEINTILHDHNYYKVV